MGRLAEIEIEILGRLKRMRHLLDLLEELEGRIESAYKAHLSYNINEIRKEIRGIEYLLKGDPQGKDE